MIRDCTADKICESVDGRREATVKMLQQLIRTPSVNPSLGDCEGEKEVVEILREKLRQMGLSRIQVAAKVKARPNLIGTLRGLEGRPVLVLNAHTDTAAVQDRSLWAVRPFSGHVKDGEVYGLGSCDMKGAITSILAAAEAILDADLNLAGDLQLVFSVDEELGSSLGMKWLLKEKRLAPNAAVVAEPSSIWRPLDHLHIAARGSVNFIIRVDGEQMHSGVADIEKPINASEKMAKVILGMKRHLKLPYDRPKYGLKPYANVGVTVRGGQNFGSTPRESVLGVNVRIIPGMTPERVVAEVKSCLRKMHLEDPDLRAHLEMLPRDLGAIMPAEIPSDEPLVKHMLKAAKRSSGYEPKLGCFPGSTDANFMINMSKIPTIASFGPGFLKYAHAPNERVSIKEVMNAAKAYALGAVSYLRES